MQTSILTSTTFATSTIALIFIAKISDLLGRKKMITSASFCLIVTLVLMAFAKSIYIYYFCLIIEGFIYAISFINVPIYNNEISEDTNRGKVGCFMGLGIPSGMLWGYIFGSLTSVKLLTLICAIPAALSLVMSSFLIESPIYLILVGKRAEALSSLGYLRKPRSYGEIENEFIRIEESVKAVSAIRKTSILNIVQNKAAVRAIYISILLCIGQQLTGLEVLVTHTKSIFDEVGSSLSGNAVGILIGVFNVSFYLLAAYFADRLGRRLLLLISELGCAICMFLLGLSFYLKDFHYSLYSHIRWFPVVCVIIFMIVYGLGLGPIPIAMISELFLPELRSLGVAIVLITSNISISVILFSYPLLKEAYAIYFVLFVYSVGGLIMFILLFFSLPETKGKSSAEIQKMLKNKT